MSEKLADLGQFHGSEHWYRHGLVRSILYTDGAKYVADQAGAYWLLDTIAAAQLLPKVRGKEFQAWKLTVAKDNSAVLICDDGNGNEVWRDKIAYTDFPPEGITLWLENNTIYLPSER